jgi:hypothetical protein
MSKKDKKKNKYVPMLSKGDFQTQRESWKEAAPRLTQEEFTKVQEITRSAYSRFLEKTPTRNNFNEIHERIEEELYDKIRQNLGLVGALEWKVSFGESAVDFFGKMGMETPNAVDGIIPTTDFLNSELFDYVQEFSPILVLLQFDEYDKFMRSAEQSIDDAEKRRGQGDAYFTERDRAINYRSETGTSDSLDSEDSN